MNSEIMNTQKEVSKELETITFMAFKISQLRKGQDIMSNGDESKRILRNNKVTPLPKRIAFKATQTQLQAFQSAMKLAFIYGQFIGLNPVQGILAKDITKIRFTMYSWRFLQCVLVGLGQLFAVTICFYCLFKNSISIGLLGYISFYATTCTTTFLFIQIGFKWPRLMKDISKCNLNQYVDINMKVKCIATTITFISVGMFEHLLSLLHKLVNIISCPSDDRSIYESFLTMQFPWFFYLNVQPSVPLGIILQILNLLTTMNWNYLDSYIICISMYLSSILRNINTKVIAASEKSYIPPSYWRALREDYTRATRLIKSFDDVFSGLVFTSFASNLFFICLQVFNVLAHGVHSQIYKKVCPEQESNGVFGGNEYTVYLIFSIIYLVGRALIVSLVAASVNTASMIPAQALYNVPSSAFCEEVSRFITQVNEDKIALSGFQFFYVTRDLVLTVAGTIVTYELVLLQFSTEVMK